MTERRIRRSTVQLEALALLLESHRRRLKLRGLVVTTREGRVLAAAGPSPGKLARLAVAPQISSDVATWSLHTEAQDVVIASSGGRLSHDLGTDVRRILSL